jgi:hypothetical protein
MTKSRIGGNLEEMYDRVQEEGKKLEEQIILKDAIIKELDDKYHFDRMRLSIERFDDILPCLIDYINDPNSESKESLLRKITEFLKCYRDG